MYEHERDQDQFSIVCDPARIVYASRPTRPEIERVLEEQGSLVRKFGTPRIVPPQLVVLKGEA